MINIVGIRNLTASKDDTRILAKLYEFINHWEINKDFLQTVCVIFKLPIPQSEIEFEVLLWDRLQKLHELDSEMYPWDTSVSSNVSDPLFSYSLKGHGFFIVGLHPASSRNARRFNFPTLVFNLHEQFELIRYNGTFEKMRDKIREADVNYSGSINPMVEDFGKITEAIQYSGRHVPASYICPFKNKVHLYDSWQMIEPCSGVGFILKKNDFLVVEDFMGEQVSDLFCFSRNNSNEFLSSGKSIDYNHTLRFTETHDLYSNLSNIMLSIVLDEVGEHDFLFAPCNQDTFRLLYKDKSPTTGCYENLVEAL